jgi:hypothetical protein
MRRRLTVTGASQNIDGVVKPGVAESSELKKFKGKKDKVREIFFSYRIVFSKYSIYSMYAVYSSVLSSLLDIGT